MKTGFATGLSLLILLVCGVATAAAQTGSITGTVSNRETGEPVSGARVEVVGATSGETLTGSLTDAGGRFRIAPVAPGTYVVVVNTIGYSPERVADVRVAAGEAVELAIELDRRAIELNPVVVSASKRVERSLQAPARVEVVGTEQIETRPTVQPVDHLRSTPGVDIVTQGLQSSNVVARGFNNIFSGALLALTDHRIASVPSLRVNTLYMIPANNEDVERMEVVLGPGSALYGPNTANGVLHIFTKSPLVSQETSASVAAGSQSVVQGTFRTSQLLTDNFGIKLSGQYLQGEEFGFTDPVEEEARRRILPTDPGTRIGLRDFDLERWGIEARADWRVTPGITTVFQAGRTNSGSGIELTGIGAAQVKDWMYSYYQARMTSGRLFAQAYLNTSDAGDTFLLRDADAIVDESKLFAAQLQHGVGLGERQNFTYGLDYFRTMPETGGTIHGSFEDDDLINEVGGFLQSETALHPKLDLVLAGRLDYHSEIEDPIFSPRAAVVFKPADDQSLRVTYNRAFSAPQSVNLFLDRNAGPVPGALGDLGFSLRAQGTGAEGFTFRQPDGSFLMRSPFTPAGAGGPGTLLPANAAAFYPAAVQVLAAQSAAAGQPLPPQLVDFLNSLAPNVQAEVGTSILDPISQQVTPLASATIADIPGIEESTTSTFEVGYKGILGRRVLLAADAWYTQKENFISPLIISTPLLLLNGAELGQVVVPAVTQFFVQAGLPQEAAQAQATQIATGLAQVPVGVISSADVNAEGADLLVTYRNFGNVDLWGADLSATALLTDQWSLTVGGSWASDDHFETEGQIIALNAPALKGTLSLGYRDEAAGLSAEARVRYTDGFPVNSGVSIGLRCIEGLELAELGEDCVDSFTLFDIVGSYRFPGFRGASVQLMIQNLLDDDYQSFIGVPEVGRLALLRLKYEF